MADPTVQYWLAELDRYGNPRLVDGPHPDEAGALRAMATFEALHSGNNFLGQRIGAANPHGYAIARVELTALPLEMQRG